AAGGIELKLGQSVEDRLPRFGSTLLLAISGRRDLAHNLVRDLGDLLTQERQVLVRALDRGEWSIALGHHSLFGADSVNAPGSSNFPAPRRDTSPRKQTAWRGRSDKGG